MAGPDLALAVRVILSGLALTVRVILSVLALTVRVILSGFWLTVLGLPFFPNADKRLLVYTFVCLTGLMEEDLVVLPVVDLSLLAPD